MPATFKRIRPRNEKRKRHRQSNPRNAGVNTEQPEWLAAIQKGHSFKHPKE